MARCEDFPCCGHGPTPIGDGGGCPDERGRFRCVECGQRMPSGASSAICQRCREERACMDEDEREYLDDVESRQEDYHY
ncbi:hypothetical protein LCGC14_2269500 [marine sediment metagenome]|uniref:Uncharacterized protein n=1 Tax=marine sediment metagenome TaxID=412755 RepID=A0A0F9DJL2_9ZZZZ